MASIIQWRRDTAANWIAANPILAQGEAGLELDTGYWKHGDGVTAWVDLPYTGTGPEGPIGPPGPDGPQGPVGPGVAGGGQAGQVLTKVDGTEYNTVWADAPENIPLPPEDTTPYSGVNTGGVFSWAKDNLNNLSNVDVDSATQGEYLYYDEATSTWKSKISVSALGIIEFDYRWSNAPNTTPSTGQISSDNADPALVTTIYVNETSNPGKDLSLFWDNISAGDWLNYNAPGAADVRNSYDVTGTPVKTGEVYAIPVTVFNVTPYLPGNNNQVSIFLRFGVEAGGVGWEYVPGTSEADLQNTNPGFVGIGLNPLARLHVDQIARISRNNLQAGLQMVRVVAPDATGVLDGAELARIDLRGGWGTTTSTGARISGVASENWTELSNPADIIFSTTPSGSAAPVDVARITKDGKLVVGPTTPNALSRFTVVNDSSSGIGGAAAFGISSQSFGTQNSTFNLISAEGTPAAPTPTVADRTIGTLTARGFDGTNYSNSAAIQFKSKGEYAPDATPCEINFRVSGDTGTLVTQMTLDKDGNLGLGVEPEAGFHTWNKTMRLERDIGHYMYLRRGPEGTIPLDNDVLGVIGFQGYQNATAAAIGSTWKVSADGDWADGSAPTKIEFSTTADGTTTQVTHLRIDSDGWMSFGGAGQEPTDQFTFFGTTRVYGRQRWMQTDGGWDQTYLASTDFTSDIFRIFRENAPAGGGGLPILTCNVRTGQIQGVVNNNVVNPAATSFTYLTQAEYDAIPTKDPLIFYIVVG